jgi:hypothetical protein
MSRGLARPVFGPSGARVWTSSGVVAVGLITAGAVTLTAIEALGSCSRSSSRSESDCSSASTRPGVRRLDPISALRYE